MSRIDYTRLFFFVWKFKVAPLRFIYFLFIWPLYVGIGLCITCPCVWPATFSILICLIKYCYELFNLSSGFLGPFSFLEILTLSQLEHLRINFIDCLQRANSSPSWPSRKDVPFCFHMSSTWKLNNVSGLTLATMSSLRASVITEVFCLNQFLSFFRCISQYYIDYNNIYTSIFE